MARARARRDAQEVRTSTRSSATAASMHARVLELQRSAGNRATTALLQRRAEPVAPTGPPGVQLPREESAPTVDLRLTHVEVLNPRVRRGQAVLAKFTVVNEGSGKT